MSEPEGRLDHLYVIGEGNGCGIVKIGRSTSPAARLSGVQTGNPRKVRLLLVVPEAGQHEDAVHRKFSSHRLGGEWFDLGKGDPVERVQQALDEILRAEPELRTAPPGSPQTPGLDALPPGPLRRSVCKEAGCDAPVYPLLSAAVQWFVSNHPDPAAFLLEQGFAWHCIEEAFGAKLPEVSKQAINRAAQSVPS